MLALVNVIDPFVSTLALVGVVIVVSALLSGLIERSGVPQVGVLLALGAVLGPVGLGLVHVTLESPVLRAVSILSLALVLFTDALSVNLAEVRQHGRLTLLILGPGTLLAAVLVGFSAWWLLGLPAPGAAILGAALASTDPVLLRGLLRRTDIPGEARLGLRLESGLNDVVLLPIVLVAMVLSGTGQGFTPQGWSRMGIQLFLLGPGAGVVVGLLGVAALDLVRRRIGVRRDYESLYSLGIAFAAYAGAEALHGSGFLAAFAAGLTISVFDVELCDCFMEYGETTAELALLFTFVLLGSSLIWSGLTIVNGPVLLFAAIALLARPVALLAALGPRRLPRRSLLLLIWFGPRGLSSLLLVLLPVFAGVPGGAQLFPYCSLVVLLSVLLHGGSIMLLGRGGSSRRETGEAVPPIIPKPIPSPFRVLPSETVPAPAPSAPSGVKLDIAELRSLWDRGEQAVILDVRRERSLEGSETTAQGAVRLDPEHAVDEAKRLHLPREAWLIAFCA
jgi:NhaP-type Na+/H+ or K+/H+ antiporter